jgi:hypothetical protein
MYLSYDKEMTARAPIYSTKDSTKEDGPFDKGLIIDSMKVFIVL